jgi:hypothetical protein
MVDELGTASAFVKPPLERGDRDIFVFLCYSVHMTTLSDYRASIRRLLEAEDINKAFKDEGFGSGITMLVSKSKSFNAVRSAIRDKRKDTPCIVDKMSHHIKH